MKVAWQIFYADNSTFSDQDGRPEDAPGWGVLAVAQKDELVNAQIHHGSDFYCYAEQFGGWAGLDYFGLAQYMAKPGTKIVKLGEMVSTERYRALVAELRKTARLPWERKF